MRCDHHIGETKLEVSELLYLLSCKVNRCSYVVGEIEETVLAAVAQLDFSTNSSEKIQRLDYVQQLLLDVSTLLYNASNETRGTGPLAILSTDQILNGVMLSENQFFVRKDQHSDQESITLKPGVVELF